MKNLTKIFVAFILIAVLILSATRSSFAAGNTFVDFDLTPLEIGTDIDPAGNAGYPQLITHSPPVGDWTTTGTSTSASNDTQEDIIGYSLKIPEDVVQCTGGQPAYVVGHKRVLETKDADPNIQNPNYTSSNIRLLSGPTLGIADQNSSFDYTTTAPEGTLNGIQAITSYYKNPMTIDTFNDSLNTFIGTVSHVAQEGDFTVTTAPPILSAVLNCDGVEAVGSEFGGGGGSGDGAEADSAKSPKTGASEVLIALFLVVLASSSFIIYKALHKHRNTEKLSEK